MFTLASSQYKNLGTESSKEGLAKHWNSKDILEDIFIQLEIAQEYTSLGDSDGSDYMTNTLELCYYGGN